MSWSSLRSTGAVLLIALLGSEARAVTFDITGTTVGPGNATVNALAIQALENVVNRGLFPSGSEDAFLGQMGDANALSPRGLENDPLLTPGLIVVGAGVGVAETGSLGNGAGARKNSLPNVGVSGQGSVFFGGPASLFGLKKDLLGIAANRLSFFGNFMTLSFDNAVQDLKLGMTTFGVGAQYVLIPEVYRVRALRWGGLTVSSGVQYSFSRVSYYTKFDSTDSSSGSVNMTWNAAGDLGVRSSAVSIPIQFTSSVTVLYIATFYAGLGADLNFGSSHLEGNVNGPVTGKDSGNTTVFTGTGTLDTQAANTVSPSFISTRGLLGGQVNLGTLKIFAQGNHGFNTKGNAGQLGLKLAF